MNSRDGDGRDVIICSTGNDVAVVSDGDTVTDGCEDIWGGTPSEVVTQQEGTALAAAL